MLSEAARLRHGQEQLYHAQACSLGVPNGNPTRPHRADPWEHQVSALFGLRPSGGRTPALTRQLCRRCTPLSQSASQITFTAFRCLQTVETIKNSSVAPNKRQVRHAQAARLRPAKTAAIWARCSACRPGDRHSRETDQLFVASLIFRYIAFSSRSLHSQNSSDSLRKPS